MFGLGKDDLSEEDWAAFVRIVQAVDRKNGGKEEKKEELTILPAQKAKKRIVTKHLIRSQC